MDHDGPAAGLEARGLPQRQRITLTVRGRATTLTGPSWAYGLALHALVRLVCVLAGLSLFVLALQFLQAGARELRPLLEALSVHGVPSFLGLGWLGACFLMSGSPAAAIAVSLVAAGAIGQAEGFAMINGSRLGASFIVLAVGFVLYLFRRRTADGIYVGVVALLTSLTIWAPALPLGLLVLHAGWLDSAHFTLPGPATAGLKAIYGPVVERLVPLLPGPAAFLGGVAFLLAAFFVFDRALPQLEQGSLVGRRWRSLMHLPPTMFLLGLGVTALTMSVSLSVGLLVPLSLRGYLRREDTVPYVMGANISTWMDTLAAAAILGSGAAFVMVLTEVVVGSLVSGLVLLFVFRPYSRGMVGLAHFFTSSRWRFIAFLAFFLLMPLLLLFL